jgi:hypothetical protein
MPHLFEPASSGRARCRGCGRRIESGELRFGERLPNAFGDGEMTLWFHPLCAAHKRPEPVLEALAESAQEVPERTGLDVAALETTALASTAHRRLARIDGADRAPTGRAKCRSCHNTIAHGEWRIRLVLHEDGRFSPGGFLHAGCSRTYFEEHEVIAPLLHFSPDLNDDEREELKRACAGGPNPAPPPQA